MKTEPNNAEHRAGFCHICKGRPVIDVDCPHRLRTLGEYCPKCKRPDALSVWTVDTPGETTLICDYCGWDERDD